MSEAKRMGQELVVIQVGGILRTEGVALPAILTPDSGTAERVLDFFTANIRNPNTRKAYARAVASFAAWCERHGLAELRAVRPRTHRDLYRGARGNHGGPSVKLQLAAIRMLFDWLVVGQIVPMNPASAVRGPKHVVKKGKTPVLSAEEARELLDSIDTGTPCGLRDRALIALMVYTFARVGAADEDASRTFIRRAVAGGCGFTKKAASATTCHATTTLEAYLEAYLDSGPASATTARDPYSASLIGRTGQLSEEPMTPADVWRMIRRRAAGAGIPTQIGCHTFRATGITEYLQNGGKLEVAQQMADHESARTTGLYDRRNDQVSLDEVERILI